MSNAKKTTLEQGKPKTQYKMVASVSAERLPWFVDLLNHHGIEIIHIETYDEEEHAQ